MKRLFFSQSNVLGNQFLRSKKGINVQTAIFLQRKDRKLHRGTVKTTSGYKNYLQVNYSSVQMQISCYCYAIYKSKLISSEIFTKQTGFNLSLFSLYLLLAACFQEAFCGIVVK